MTAATETDVEAIWSLTQDAYSKWVPVIGRKPKPMTADYVKAVVTHRIDLLRQAGRLVALIEMIAGCDHLLIENVAVAPAFQGNGIGRHLMVHAEQVARSLSYGQIKLYTNKLMDKNIQLYSRLGYRVDYEETAMGGTIIHMSKAL